MVTIRREVLVEEAPAQQPRSENSNDPAAGSAPPPHPALAKDPRQEDYESVFQAFLLNQDQDYATASEEWRQQYHLHRQLAERLQKSKDLDREEARRNPQRMSDRQMQMMLLEAQNRQRLQEKLKKARDEGHDCTPVRVYEALPLCDYYQLQLMHLEANDRRRLQEKARDEGADASAVANEARKRSVEGMRIPLRPKPAEILSGPTANQLEALVQKAGYDQWRIERPIPRFEPDFSKMDREAINQYHQEMVAQEAAMRQRLLRSPLNLTLPEHRDARRDYTTEFQRLEKMNNLRLPTYYSVQADIQRSQDLALIDADPGFQGWKQQRQNPIHNAQVPMSGPYYMSPDQQPQIPLENYQIQSTLLKQHVCARFGTARQEQDSMIAGSAEPSTVTSPTQNPTSAPPQIKQERDLEAKFHGFFPRRPMPAPTWGPPDRSNAHLVYYDKQVKILEQQNKKRLSMMKKKPESMDAAIKTEDPSESSACSQQLCRLEMHNRKRPAMARDDQETMNELKATESPAPEVDTSWPSEPKAGTHVLLGYQRALAQLEQQGGKRLKVDRTASRAIHGYFPNRDYGCLPDVDPQTEVIYKAQVQQTGWAEGMTETETDRETSISTFSPTPEATPEVEKTDMTDVNTYDLEEDQRSQASGASTVSPNNARLPTIDEQLAQDERLAEEEWLKAVDDEEDSPEAAARKQARKERREQNRLKRLALTQSSSNNAINEHVARPDGDTRPLVIREKLPISASQ
jgi:hypothetical protein